MHELYLKAMRGEASAKERKIVWEAIQDSNSEMNQEIRKFKAEQELREPSEADIRIEEFMRTLTGKADDKTKQRVQKMADDPTSVLYRLLHREEAEGEDAEQ